MNFIFDVLFVIGGLPEDGFAEMHLQPDPLFSIPSDNVYMSCITGTFQGRIFSGGRDGCLYEIAYQVRYTILWEKKELDFEKVNPS